MPSARLYELGHRIFILSEDMQRGRNLGGVDIVNPFAEDAEPLVSRLLD